MLFKMNKDNLRAHVEGISYHFYINDAIDDPEDYIELIDTLYQARPTDTVYIHLNTPGGRLDITMQILNAMKVSDASVVSIADGEVSSAGTLLLFSAPNIAVQPFSSAMLHDGSEGMMAKTNENVKRALFSQKLVKKLAYECYRPFFTEEEIDSVLEGKDLYLTSEEIKERIQAVVNKEEENEEGEE